MARVVVSVLVALQMLMPPGLCVHKLGVVGQFTGHDHSSDSAEKPVSKCCSHRVPARDADESPCDDDPVPTDDPCPAGFCQAQFDKIAPCDRQVVADYDSAPFGVAPRPDPVTVRLTLPSRAVATAADPPRHVVFCTFLI